MDSQEQENNASSQAVRGGNKTFKVGGLIVLLIAVAGLAALHAFGYLKLGGPSASEATASVAMINGESISRTDFDKRFGQVKTAVSTQQPLDATSTATLQEGVLDEMINTTLLLQEAKKAGITVTDADVDQSYSDLLKNFGSEETLESQLSAVGMTKDELRVNLRNEKIIQAYLDAKTDIKSVTVTDAEIQAVYDQQFKGQEGAPTFADVKSAIESQLLQQKTGALVNDHIATLRAKADIKKTL